MTGPRHYTLFLRDILDACDEAREFVEGMTFEEFDRDRKTKLAVEREIEIIGEAANNIPEHIRQTASEVSWSKISGMRNKLAHEFFDVHYGIVWSTVREDLPPLRDSIGRILTGLAEPPEDAPARP